MNKESVVIGKEEIILALRTRRQVAPGNRMQQKRLVDGQRQKKPSTHYQVNDIEMQ